MSVFGWGQRKQTVICCQGILQRILTILAKGKRKLDKWNWHNETAGSQICNEAWRSPWVQELNLFDFGAFARWWAFESHFNKIVSYFEGLLESHEMYFGSFSLYGL